MSECRSVEIWECGLLALGSLPMGFFPFYPSPCPTGFWPEKGQNPKAWFGSYRVLGKFCLSFPLRRLLYQASASQFQFLMLAWCFTQEPKRRRNLGILSGLCFQKEKSCWIANVILNSLDVRAELTESHCLCLKQIFIM